MQPARDSNPLVQLNRLGQSAWLDFIERKLIDSGELSALIRDDDLRGLTSNPAIFEKAIAESSDYTAQIVILARAHDGDAKRIYEALAVRDIQDVCDRLRPVYDETRTRDGYASLEVAPDLAHDAAGTLVEARRLWAAVNRPNLMVKVPGTPEGLIAIRQLIEDGINVNVTLLFAESVYAEVAQAYIAGIEARARRGLPVAHVASVASFFVSRIDTAIDAQLGKRIAAGEKALEPLLGKAAIANAKRAYQRYLSLFSGPRWEALHEAGAQTQRLLWASTSTKNPSYRDVIYVEELAGPDTVNTLPPATLAAFRDHGVVRRAIDADLAAADSDLAALTRAGISLDAVTAELLADGLSKFVEPFTKLLAAVTRRAQEVTLPAATHPGTARLPEALAAAVEARLDAWSKDGNTRRLYARDASLWTGGDEAKWLGWLDTTTEMKALLPELTAFGAEVHAAGFTHVLLLGMGGSSLGPEVLAETFGAEHVAPGSPALVVLDSTDPAQVLAVEAKVDLTKTLFIVASKSGSTLEPAAFLAYFWARAQAVLGPEVAPSRFVAITDPGSKLEAQAKADGFRRIFSGVPTIGGRYSMLSPFGLVPAAAMGLDVARLLARADRMSRACRPEVATKDNPGLVLGTILGVAAQQGRDKLTLITSPGLRDLGAWLEQLVAESTGKNGKAIIPVDREALTRPEKYGQDRVFVYTRLDGTAGRPESGADASDDAALAALEKAGHPVVRLGVSSVYDLGAEMYRWEIATAIAGAVMGIHPFDQPDVEASKIETKKLTAAYEETGALTAEKPIGHAGALTLYAHDARCAASVDAPLDAHLSVLLGRLKAGDYLALLAYIPMTAAHEAQLQRIRHHVRDTRGVATCLGFGPRFLHSTGQAYKGGSDSGVFLVITGGDARDLPVPGQKWSFGVVKAAQARGDVAVLYARERRTLRVHLGTDIAAGLAALERAIVGKA